MAKITYFSVIASPDVSSGRSNLDSNDKIQQSGGQITTKTEEVVQ